MTGDGLTITGGANGVTARLDDLHAQASLLASVAEDLGEVASRLASAALSPDIAEAAVLCPLEAAQAEEALLEANVGPHGVGVAWARAEASVAFVRFAIAAYWEADRILTEAGRDLAFVGGYAAGTVAGPAAMAAVISNPLVGAALWQSRDEVVRDAQQLAYDQPWTQELATRAAPGFVEGAASSVLGGNPLLLALLSGGHWPTADLQGAVNGLLHVAGPTGLLRDSGEFSVAARGAPKAVDFGRTHFLAEVMRQQDLLSEEVATVQVVAIDGPSGRSYIVQIPGTQAWGPSRRDNPLDLATNTHLVAGHRTQLTQAVVQAMRQAQIPPDAPVMLTGHSQGGMAAAVIASDPDYREEFNLRAVVTAGSPIGRMPIPADVDVLSIEEKQDLVPKLDGADNPDRPNWVTVTHDLDKGSAADARRNVASAHSLENYQRTGSAIDAASNASISGWRTVNAQFFGRGLRQLFQISMTAGR